MHLFLQLYILSHFVAVSGHDGVVNAGLVLRVEDVPHIQNCLWNMVVNFVIKNSSADIDSSFQTKNTLISRTNNEVTGAYNK